MTEALYLSHWDAETSTFILPVVAKDLTNYHIMAIRFLYACYLKEQKGAILNEDEDMNFPVQISALLSAFRDSITEDSPVIIVCDKQSVHIWHFYLSKYIDAEITLITEGNTFNESSKIVLSVVENLKWLKNTALPFFMVVIENLDLVLNKRFVKQLKGKFRVGSTNRNFLRNPDQKLFRNLLLWAIPGSVGKLEDFITEDDDHLNNLQFPYGDCWLRLTWSFCDTFEKPSQKEQSEINARIRNWSKNHNFLITKEEKIPKKRRKNQVTEIVKQERKISIGANSDSSQDTIICDQENYQKNVDDFPILTSIINDNVKSENLPYVDEQKENSVSKEDILSLLLDEPKIEKESLDVNTSTSIIKDEDDVESRNRDILSMLYGD